MSAHLVNLAAFTAARRVVTVSDLVAVHVTRARDSRSTTARLLLRADMKSRFSRTLATYRRRRDVRCAPERVLEDPDDCHLRRGSDRLRVSLSYDQTSPRNCEITRELFSRGEFAQYPSRRERPVMEERRPVYKII